MAGGDVIVIGSADAFKKIINSNPIVIGKVTFVMITVLFYFINYYLYS